MKSIWADSVTIPPRAPLDHDISADVVVIGAGIAGILTALMLQEAGKHVVVLEKGRILSGITENTTAKITSQHALIYKRLISEFGREKAGQYAAANEKAIKQYRELIEKNKITCNFEEKCAYVYTKKNTAAIEEEVNAAKSLGIDAEYTESCTLPFPVAGAVKFYGQAQFNPLKFLVPLAENLEIYENCLIHKVKDNTVETNGFHIEGKDVVIATHYPIINAPGFYFIRMHQSRSYVIALENAQDMDGMYLADDGEYSFRNYGNLLIMGGFGHRTGENKLGGAYDNLRKSAAQWYPGSSVKYHWSAQDCMPVDGVPYIGKYAQNTDNLYVATGFQKWGMTTSMVSAQIITDQILGKHNPYEDVFSPQRFNLPASYKNIATESAYAVSGLTKTVFKVPETALEKIPVGHGGIVEYDNEKVGVYKSPSGEIYTVSTKCTHLGCQLEWNPDDLAWECPCHGSRFDYQGHLIYSPATHSLAKE